jgi:hypothetical protein
VVGQIINWITDTSRRPHRVVALGAGVTVVGTLIGRRAASPTGAATHFYVMVLAQTAAGKSRPQHCADRLMRPAGAGLHIGPSEFVSQTAVVNHILEKPLSLYTQDEFGAFLGRVNNGQSNIEWGRDVANESVTLLTRDAREHIVDGLNPSGQLQNKILYFIRKNGGIRVPSRDVYRSLRKSIRSRKDLTQSSRC